MDEVEERTSAQTSGMAGFYSNLLTRNIAAGRCGESCRVVLARMARGGTRSVDEVSSELLPGRRRTPPLLRWRASRTPCRRRPRTSARRGRPSRRRGHDAVAERLAKVEEDP